MKTHGKRKPANRMQIVQNRKMKLANRRKYKKQQEAKHQKNCNKSEGCTPGKICNIKEACILEIDSIEIIILLTKQNNDIGYII